MSPEMQKVVDEQMNEWLKNGIISRSDSPFARCLHVMLKKSGRTKTIYTLQILPTNHTPTHATSINKILFFRRTTYQQRKLPDPVE